MALVATCAGPSPPPQGQLQQPRPRPGHFRNTFSSSHPGNLKTVPPRSSKEVGAGGRSTGGRVGVRAAPPTWAAGVMAERGPWPSCPGLFSPAGSKPRTSGWGSKWSPQPRPLTLPPSPTRVGVSAAPQPALATSRPHPPHHTAPSMSLTSLFSPHYPTCPPPGTVRR